MFIDMIYFFFFFCIVYLGGNQLLTSNCEWKTNFGFEAAAK